MYQAKGINAARNLRQSWNSYPQAPLQHAHSGNFCLHLDLKQLQQPEQSIPIKFLRVKNMKIFAKIQQFQLDN
jgi:hypothetical protein